MLDDKDKKYIERIKNKCSKKKLFVSLIVFIGIIAYFYYLWFRSVSILHNLLLEGKPLAQYAEKITKMFYSVPVVFLILGIISGIGIGSYFLSQKLLKVIDKTSSNK